MSGDHNMNCSANTKHAAKMIRQPLELIEMVLLKHQEAILEVCKEQQEEITRLRAEVERLQNELAHWMNHWRTKL